MDAANYRDLAERMRVLSLFLQDRAKQQELVETASKYERLADEIDGGRHRRSKLNGAYT